jgi:hypothetical protein
MKGYIPLPLTIMLFTQKSHCADLQLEPRALQQKSLTRLQEN